jgi:hypothetical protein
VLTVALVPIRNARILGMARLRDDPLSAIPQIELESPAQLLVEQDSGKPDQPRQPRDCRQGPDLEFQIFSVFSLLLRKFR